MGRPSTPRRPERPTGVSEADLERIVGRVMATLPQDMPMPTPTVIAGVGSIPPRQRRVLVGRFRYAGVVVAPQAEWVYVYLDPLVMDFGSDVSAIEEAVRRTLVEDVGPGFKA